MKRMISVNSLIIGILAGLFDLFLLIIHTTEIPNLFFPLTGIIGNIVLTFPLVAISGYGKCFVRDLTGSSIVAETFTLGGDTFAIDKYNNVQLYYGYTISITMSLKIKFEPVS